MITSAKKQAQDLSKKIARQIAQEPLEILKSAKRQMSGENLSNQGENTETRPIQAVEEKNETNELKKKDTLHSSRTLEALDRELEDIRRDKLLKELQKGISQGEEVYLENYPELTLDQKQVLKAQVEAVKIQRAQQASVQGQALVEPKSKTPRGSWLFGGKAQAEKQKTRVEKPLPPSG